MDGFCLLYLLMILLIRSGDVETNPGPDRIVSEAEFMKLSKMIEPSYYKEVGICLGIPNAELCQIMVQHMHNTSDALMIVFTRWRDKQPPGTDIRAILAEELENSDLGSLSGKLLAGSLVQKRKAGFGDHPTPQNSNIEHQQDQGFPLSTNSFDDILVAVARSVRQNSKIDTLGRKLGFSPADIQGYIATNHKTQHITYDGTLQMLRDWLERQKKFTERGALKTALEQSGQIRLADDLFPSSLTRRTPATATFEEPMITARAAYYPTDPTTQGAFGLGTDLKIDQAFDRLSKHMPGKKYTSLCTGLGIEFNEANNTLLRFNMDYQRANRSCLADWKTRTGGTLVQLKTILLEIGAEDLVKYIE